MLNGLAVLLSLAFVSPLQPASTVPAPLTIRVVNPDGSPASSGIRVGIMIGFGKGVDRTQLDQVAQVTDGAVYIANTPAEVQKIFLEAISRRVCAPTCKTN